MTENANRSSLSGDTPLHLITTADQRSWKHDRPVLFLGEWCRRYEKRAEWAGMDGIVARPYGVEREQKHRDLVYANALWMRLLEELSVILNKWHGAQYGVRYWHIVLGPWLHRYVQVALNRYATLEAALRQYSIAATTVFDAGAYTLATADTESFIWATNDDVWNHVFYARALRHIGGVVLDSGPVHVEGWFVADAGSVSPSGRGLTKLSSAMIDRLLRSFCRSSDAFISQSALPFKEEVLLSLSLGQCPQRWNVSKPAAAIPCRVMRQELTREIMGGYSGFEDFVRETLPEAIPTCFVEGYRASVQEVQGLPWPKSPKFIFTSNRFEYDEKFKLWAAEKVSNGVPYFTGQHGSNYGVRIGTLECTEMVTCDKFFTWGWSNNDHRNVPAFVLTVAGQRQAKTVRRDGHLLLVELHANHRLGPADSEHEFALYQEAQFRFVAALPAAIREQLIVRLHGSFHRFQWAEQRRWQDNFPAVALEQGVAPIRDLIAGSRLAVYSYDSTGLLESLALNIPVIAFWNGGLDHHTEQSKPYYELLRQCGIVADTPELAAMAVSRCWDDVSAWWTSSAVQDARREFGKKYARFESRPIRTLRQLFTAHARDVSALRSMPIPRKLDT